PGPARVIRSGENLAVMLGDDARDNRQAQAGPSSTRRKVWLKQALEIGRGNSFTGIFHGCLKQLAVNIVSRRDHDATAVARVSQCFQRVIDQVYKDAFHLLDVQQGRRQGRLQRQSQLNSVETIVIELRRLPDDFVEVAEFESGP